MYDIAVVGATGAVGTMMLSILAERNFPVGHVYPLASARSHGKTVFFKEQPLMVEDVAQFDFSKTALRCFLRAVKSLLNMHQKPLNQVVS